MVWADMFSEAVELLFSLFSHPRSRPGAPPLGAHLRSRIPITLTGWHRGPDPRSGIVAHLPTGTVVRVERSGPGSILITPLENSPSFFAEREQATAAAAYGVVFEVTPAVLNRGFESARRSRR